MVGDAAGQKFYQYTAIDEFSRFRYVEAFNEASTYTSTLFLEHAVNAFPFPVECVQTDNGFEFTKHFSPTSRNLLSNLHSNDDQFRRGLKVRYLKLLNPSNNSRKMEVVEIFEIQLGNA